MKDFKLKHYLIISILLSFCTGMYGSNSSYSAYQETLFVYPLPIVQLQFPYNINTDYVISTLTTTGSITQSNSFAVMQSGTGPGGSAILQSRARLAYKPGQGCTCLFTAIFTQGVAGNLQAVGIGNTQEGFYFGYNQTDFSVLRLSGGVFDWIPQTSWNGDKFDGTGPSGVTLIPTNGNVFKIQYQWLGFGIINFFIENPETGLFVLVHSIPYANVNTNPSLSNASMQLLAATYNIGGTTNVTVQTSSMAGILEGKLNPYTDTRNAIFNTKSISTTATSIFAIRNKTTYQAVPNQVMIFPDNMSIMNTSAGTNSFIVTLLLNPATFTGATFANNISLATSVVEYDTVGTTVTGGTEIASFYCCASNKQVNINLSDMRLSLAPGDVLVFLGQTSAGSNVVYCSVSWAEGF